MVFCSFPGFTDKSGDTAQPRILAAIVLCMFYSFTYTLICLGKKQISDMTSVWCFFFSWRSDCSFFPWKGQSVFQKFQPWVFEKLIRVACLSLFSLQVSLGNFHIMAFVDRLLGLTVNMFEKLSSW